MKKYICIGLGGGLGALARWFFKSNPVVGFRGALPINILLINISGSLLLAFFLTLAFKARKADPDIKLGITTGFIGAYTTFSTYCREIYTLVVSGDYYNAVLYAVASVLLGLAAAYTGVVLAGSILPGLFTWLQPRIVNKDLKPDEEID